MKKTKENMRKLIEQRERLQAEVEALKNKIAGLDMAIKLIDGEDSELNEQSPRTRRGNVKGTLLELLEKSGSNGLNAATAVEMAAALGVDLDRASVSSLLSRLKREGTVKYDGNNYTLRQGERTFEELLGQK